MDGVFKRNEDGTLTPAVPLGMKCEHKGCESQIGQDYNRKSGDAWWKGEPIFLCEEHSTGYVPIKL